jgi:hypothetical protein
LDQRADLSSQFGYVFLLLDDDFAHVRQLRREIDQSLLEAIQDIGQDAHRRCALRNLAIFDMNALCCQATSTMFRVSSAWKQHCIRRWSKILHRLTSLTSLQKRFAR